jgi:two-component system, OmpR family, response regulator
MKVLLVEDDPMIGEAISQALADAGHAVTWLVDGLLGASALQRHGFEFLLLDLGLPNRDGLQLLTDVRRASDPIPVILITARDGVEHRIQGLDMGADDCLVKPFEVNELLARVRAVTRRRAGTATALISNGSISLDPATKEASSSGGVVQLTRREYALLYALLLRPGAILSRSELEDRIYGWGEEVESNVVDFIIHGIRKKLGSDVIHNVRGLGWSVGRTT